MFKRPELRIHYMDMQKMIDDFCQSQRPWNCWTSTKIDHIARFYIPEMVDYIYGGFDTETNEAKFVWKDVFNQPIGASVGLIQNGIKQFGGTQHVRLLLPGK